MLSYVLFQSIFEEYGSYYMWYDMKLNYEISCCNCGLGPDKTGTVLMTYNEDSMQGVIDDSNLKQLIKEWDSILRDPEKEKGN